MSALLRIGSRGSDVAEVQKLLNSQLSPSPNLRPDGIFGRLTASAVKQFQASQTLKVDGIVGPNTRRVLSSRGADTGFITNHPLACPDAAPLSIREAAYLAEDVYDSSPVCTSIGWQRADFQLWGNGFAAMRYRKGDRYAVAYRGTDDHEDWLYANLFMAPQISGSRLRSVLRKLLVLYGINDIRLDLIVATIASALSSPGAIFATRVAALATNRVPPEQSQLAMKYFDATPGTIVAVTGHSLGGALAKVVSDERSVPAFAFNSPFMGTMRGTIQQSSMLIKNIFTPRDPLSFITRELGNLSHGESISRLVEHYPISRPRPQATTSQNWYTRLWNNLPAGQVRQQYQEIADIVGWLGDAALHYHGMKTLRKAL